MKEQEIEKWKKEQNDKYKVVGMEKRKPDSEIWIKSL